MLVVCGALLWFIVRTHRATAELETRLAAASKRNAKLNAKLKQAEKVVVPRPASAPAKSVTVPTATDAKPASPAPAPRPPGLMDLAHDNPQLMNLWVANQRSQLQQRYGVLFQNLRLSAAQREKFKDVISAEAARGADIGAAAKEQGVDFDDPVITKLHADSGKQRDAGLLALLGEHDFHLYQEFERTVLIRGFVDGFAVQVATSNPLTAPQAEQLAQALIAASPALQKGGRAEPTTVDWFAVDRAAQDFLSPAQFAAWKLGIAHNPYGGSRIDQALKKVHDAAKAR
jgi:hypothetical protein